MTATLDEPILEGGIRRVNFFNGRLLTARDLSRVQLAAAAGDQRLGVVIGDGVSHGLEVSAPDPGAASPWVRVQGGLAVNRAGETLCLDAAIDVALAVPPEPGTATADCCFAPCAPAPGGTYVAGAGVFLLMICSAEASEGRAMTSGLDETAGRCNTDATVNGVRFRLVQVDPYLAADDFHDGARARDDHEIRNRVAFKCFGATPLAAYDAQPLATDAKTYGLLDAMRFTGVLSDCDVPLAVLYRTLAGGLRFVDNWAARRSISQPSPFGLRGPHLSDRRAAEAEAMMLQFEVQAERLRSEQGAAAPAVQVERWFSHLPPVALLRTGGAQGLDWKIFLGAHAPVRAVPLSAGLARAVVQRSLEAAAVPVVARTNTADKPIRYRVYEVDGATDFVLIARSSYAETIAKDVYYDNANCALDGADNVQDAIDQLCERVNGCCTVVLTPHDADWQAKVDAVPVGGDAEICFQVGDYPLLRPLEIKGLGHVKLNGAGFGTRLMIADAEVALLVRDCQSVIVRDLSFTGGAAGWAKDVTEGLGGALTVVNCAEVTVETVEATCADALRRAAACVVVRNTAEAPAKVVSITGVRGRIGHAQTGVLVVNAVHAVIERNTLALAPGADISKFANEPEHLIRFRRQLVSVYAQKQGNGKAPPTADREHADAVDFSFGDASVQVRTHPDLAQILGRILEDLDVQVSFPDQLGKALKDFAAEVARGRGEHPGLSNAGLKRAVKTAFERMERRAAPAAQQGIVVGGAAAPDVRIRDNAVSGVEQGIHIGLSDGPSARRGRAAAGTVQIGGNVIELMISSLTTGERHAIFVGGAESLVIEANRGQVARNGPIDRVTAEPIRLWGEFGRRLLVTGNHFEGFRRAIYLRPFLYTQDDDERPWVVQHNWVAGARSALEIYPNNLAITVFEPNFT
ncbi:hypothetical protein [Phenylobacterium immobile]|uniref:hypothetical protein n=1 Tax=Phenylobacterium immobile TaxID=21 RepID=UPI000B27113C|nr:hypothetical protein [Phenylobacterium immobile]